MKKILLMFITVLLCASITAQNNVSLKMNLEKNKVYRFKSTTEQTVNQTINGNLQTIGTKTSNVISLKMIDNTQDFLVAEVRVDTMRTESSATGKPLVMSSAVEGDIKSKETSDIVSCVMNRLSRNPVYVKMDYAGKPFEIVNAKMLSDMILKDTSAIILTGIVRTTVKGQLTAIVSENTLKALIGTFTDFLPAKEVEAGGSWTKAERINSGGMDLEISTTYKLDGINGNSANVTAESEIRAAANAAPIQSGGATVTYDNLAGLTKSNLVVDTRTGLVISEKVKTHISGNLGISGPGFSMQMPMDINGTTSIVAL